MGDCANAVLIVDDNTNVRAALRAFLERNMKIRVCGEAANGLEAIAMATARKPGLILMDLSMPSMTGVEAASIIKKQSPEARIIVFTLYSDTLSNSMARAVGVDVVVSKSDGATGLMNALLPLIAEHPEFH
jgi:DNA-binding NarL/FixJ family response regulator